jgi:predicted nucleic-acid-binding Zn-ribbon protein
MDHPTRRLDEDGDKTTPEHEATRRLDRPVRPPASSADTSCRNCGSTTIWTDVHTPGTRGIYLQQINGSILWGPKRTELAALMCTECGYTELYAYEPKKLLEG